METKIKKSNSMTHVLSLERIKILAKQASLLVYRYKYSLIYIALIVLLNVLFVLTPFIKIVGAEVSPLDWMVGVIYVLRDFSQRELDHKVIVAMLIGSVLSYFLSDKAIALASVSAFLIVNRLIVRCTRLRAARCLSVFCGQPV